MHFSINSNIAHLRPLISLVSHANKPYAYMQHTPIFMTKTCVYKSIVETHVLLTNNE